MANRDRSRLERYAERAGSWLGGGLIGLALGSYVDPWLIAHHWPAIAQELIPGIASAGGGILGDVLASRVRAVRKEVADGRQRAELKQKISALRNQLATITDETAREMQSFLDRREADFDDNLIDNAMLERDFFLIRDKYLSLTGSEPVPPVAARSRRPRT